MAKPREDDCDDDDSECSTVIVDYEVDDKPDKKPTTETKKSDPRQSAMRSSGTRSGLNRVRIHVERDVETGRQFASAGNTDGAGDGVTPDTKPVSSGHVSTPRRSDRVRKPPSKLLDSSPSSS